MDVSAPPRIKIWAPPFEFGVQFIWRSHYFNPCRKAYRHSSLFTIHSSLFRFIATEGSDKSEFERQGGGLRVQAAPEMGYGLLEQVAVVGLDGGDEFLDVFGEFLCTQGVILYVGEADTDLAIL